MMRQAQAKPDPLALPSTASQCAEGCVACDGSPDNCFAICMDGFGLVAKPDNKGACEKCQQANCNECE